MSIRRKKQMPGRIGVDFILHHYKTGEEIRMNIPMQEHWYWGQMPSGTNYVSSGNCIHFIKESYEEFWNARCEAYNKHYRLGKYMDQ